MPILARALIAPTIVAAVAIAFAGSTTFAGPGHDHGPVQNTAAGPSSPRIVAVSENYELVGIRTDGKLIIYLDRRADTSPVTNAVVELTIAGDKVVAEPQPDGTYALTTPALEKDGVHEVIVTILENDSSDLLIGTLEIPPSTHQDHTSSNEAGTKPTKVPRAVTTISTRLGLSPEQVSHHLLNTPVLAGLGLAFGILLGTIARRRTALIVGLACIISLFGASVAFAGPGHDHGHGHASSGGANGDAPRRLPDGALFLPKPTQRLLDIRTLVLEPKVARATTSLIGRVISDPNYSGLVQSTIGGRMKTPKAGFPVLGQKVERGQVLALVEPAFAPIDASDVRQTAGDLEQRSALLKAQIARQRRLVEKEVASRARLEDLEIELAGVKARQAQLRKSSIEPEVLKAPVDGVIAEVRVVAGQVVASADTLFHIIDPNRLWVEAIAFDPRLGFQAASALAHTADGQTLQLDFVGRSRALQQQATVLQFRIKKPTEALSIGSPVKVQVETGDPITGLIVSRSAIAQAPNGQMVAFKRLEPERYQPQAVRFESIDGARVRITGGLKTGDQIIVRNAPLVNQIR